MTKASSNDLRERVVAALHAGDSCRVVAKRFKVAPSSVVKWSQRFRKTGSIAPCQIGGYRKVVLEPYLAFILARIDETPHLTLHGLKAELAAHGIMVSHDTVWRFLRAKGLSFKKKPVRQRTEPA